MQDLKNELHERSLATEDLKHVHELDKASTLTMIETQVRQTILLKDQIIEHLTMEKNEATTKVNVLRDLMEKQREVGT